MCPLRSLKINHSLFMSKGQDACKTQDESWWWLAICYILEGIFLTEQRTKIIIYWEDSSLYSSNTIINIKSRRRTIKCLEMCYLDVIPCCCEGLTKLILLYNMQYLESIIDIIQEIICEFSNWENSLDNDCVCINTKKTKDRLISEFKHCMWYWYFVNLWNHVKILNAFV